ncbi:sodium channel protein Nach-like [Contarinia nasturtii]|uniref:sodium channel protein Nach-like n=1 Tax=Contarinia nasturtii TaxID=265458 RepID=UPI0012D3FD96|nr:sodium channel protein Nach-like [Contarinia nasturtii]
MLLFCAYYIIFSLLVDDQLRFFAFTIDTIYLHWNVSFPAITICEMFNGGKIWELSEKFYGADRNSKLDDFLSDIAFFSGQCHSCSLCGKNFECPTNFSVISSKFRSSCDEMISNCLWNNVQIECCTSFLPLETEFGVCYTINSIHTTPMYGHRLLSSRSSGPGSLSFTTNEDVQVHVHTSNEVPSDTESDIKEDIFYGTEKELVLKVIDMVNDASIQDASITNRKCRFPWETRECTNIPSHQYPMLYSQYSYSTCSVECSMEIQIELCNCTHHLMPKRLNAANTCDIDGLICLTNNFGKINSKKKDCNCLASCDEPEYSVLYSSPAKEDYRYEPGSLITISMLELSKERLIRRVVKTMLDDVISIASIISLMFGLSILSTLDYLTKTIKLMLSAIMFLIRKKIIIQKKGNGHGK